MEPHFALVAQQRADTLGGLCAAHQLSGGGGQLGGALERGEGDQDDNGEQHLCERTGRGLRDPDEQGTDDGRPHGAHVEAASQGRELR